MHPILYVVIPCYNEEEVLPITSKSFLKQLTEMMDENLISEDSRILYVDDGSSDSTWDLISKLSSENKYFVGIRQSRNRGHQNAVLAGLMESISYADITISIDCDGQDDITAMNQMVRKYHEGNEVVYGVRDNRDSDTWFKRNTAQLFYKMMNALGTETIYNHADYRLISTKVLKEFAQFGEVNLFLRGMIPLVGFKSTTVSYARHERLAGKSHYPLSKMIGLATDGVTSLSVKPLRMISILGFTVSLLSFIAIIWTIIGVLLGNTIVGWASTITIIAFLGGVQLLSLGIIGEYIGKMYMETKHRPRYIISERVGLDEDKEKN